MRKHRITAAKCPNCGMPNDAYEAVSDSDAHPKPGDITMCLYCSTWSIYEEGFTLRKATAEEVLLVSDGEWLKAEYLGREVQKKILTGKT